MCHSYRDYVRDDNRRNIGQQDRFHRFSTIEKTGCDAQLAQPEQVPTARQWIAEDCGKVLNLNKKRDEIMGEMIAQCNRQDGNGIGAKRL